MIDELLVDSHEVELLSGASFATDLASHPSTVFHCLAARCAFMNAKLMSQPSAYSFAGNAIFQKTQRGHAEFSGESNVLHPRLRRFLVFIDGVKNIDELVQMTSILGDMRGAIADLQREGFIEQIGGSGPSNVTPLPGAEQSLRAQLQGASTRAPQPAPPPAAPQAYAPPAYTPPPTQTYSPQAAAIPLEQIKALMLSDLRGRMGRDADLIAPKILGARTGDDLLVMMMRLRDILEKYSGPTDADQFVRKFKDMLV
jgi:hypothetical protein